MTASHSPPTAAALRTFVVATLEDLADRHAPRLALPRVLAGHPVGPDARADLIYTLGLLADTGVATVAGLPIEEVLNSLLGGVDGDATDTFFSYRIAETLARRGPFDGNPLLAGLSAAQVEQVRTACDSTAAVAKLETSLPRNYLPVLARCELARHRLGLDVPAELLDELVERTRALFTEESGGFVDDARHRAGRFDIYSVDCYLLAEPLADRLGESWARGASRALELVQTVAAGNGAAIPWGRSAGSLALCVTLEAAAMGFDHGLIAPESAAAWSARADNAFASLRGWFTGGLVTAHQYRSPYAYRGPARRLQMTFDILGKMALASMGLDGVAPIVQTIGTGRASRTVDEPVDRLLWFDDARRHGLWSYRSAQTEFTLAFVGATTADYLPALQNPGMFEVPVGGPLATGLPFAVKDGATFAAAGAPADVRKHADGLTVEHHGWYRTGEVNARFDTIGLGARRRATYQVRGRVVRVEEELWFDEAPDAVALQVCDSRDRPLRVKFETGHPHSVTSIDTSGISEYRSYWGELPRTHQIDIKPARHLRFSWTMEPKRRILSPSAQHPYISSLSRALADDIALIPWSYQPGPDDPVVAECDGFHVHWPERMMPRRAELHRRLIAELKSRAIPIVWTQHNLAPHDPGPEDVAIYRAWAEAADAVIHHSRAGMRRAREVLPYSAAARHHVIPHGLFGEPGSRLSGAERHAAEAARGLRHDVLRLGIIGAPRPGKRVDLAMAAVAGSARDDIELVVFSLADGDRPPADHRIVAERYRHVSTAEYDARLGIIDVLVLPFDADPNADPNAEPSTGTGSSAMLATGTVADAIGRGLPCLTSSWPYLSEVLGDAALPYGSSASDLRERIDALTAAEIEQAAQRMANLRPRYDWKSIGALHLDVWEGEGEPV